MQSRQETFTLRFVQKQEYYRYLNLKELKVITLIVKCYNGLQHSIDFNVFLFNKTGDQKP